MLSSEPCASQAGVLPLSYTSNMRVVFMVLGMWCWLRGTAEPPGPPGERRRMSGSSSDQVIFHCILLGTTAYTERSTNLLLSWGDQMAELRLESCPGLFQFLHSVTNMCSACMLMCVGSLLSWLHTNNTSKAQRVDSRAAAVRIGCIL